MTLPTFQHSTPAFKAFSGADALAALPRELDRVGARRAVVVCGASMVAQRAALEKVEAALGGRLAGRFDGVREHSPVDVVRSARDLLAGVGADAVVAVGGGSAVVTARAATVLLAEGDDVRALCTRRGDDGRLVSPRLQAPKLPQWVVPSTPTTAYAKAGSAVRDPRTGERLALFDPKTRAQGVLFDADVALTSPPALARASALNAFAMSVEGLLAQVDDVLAHALLGEALRVLVTWLPRLDAEPESAEVRLRLMAGALLSGQGSDFVGGGLAQALSHAAGPRSAAPNGVVEAMLLPATVRYAAPVAQPGVARLLSAFGRDTGERPVEEVVLAVSSVLDSLGLPRRLREVGIDAEALAAIADATADDWFAAGVPRPAGPDELRALLTEVW